MTENITEMIVMIDRVLPTGEELNETYSAKSVNFIDKFVCIGDTRGNKHYIYSDSIVELHIYDNAEDIKDIKEDMNNENGVE